MAGREGISVPEAIAHIRSALSRTPAVDLPLERAHGRTLAADVVARADQPSGDDAALDGIACRVEGTEGVRDDVTELRRRLDAAAATADLILTSGGVSMGAHDLVRALMEREGEVGFWRVAMKPGGPVLFGHWRGTPLLGLPGNPVASLVAFWLLAQPALQALAGDAGPAPFEAPWPARVGNGLRPAGGRLHVARVRLRRVGDALVADGVATQSSGVLRSLATADALALIAPDRALTEGDPIDVLPLRSTYGRSHPERPT